jgi:hypothetical protein
VPSRERSRMSGTLLVGLALILAGFPSFADQSTQEPDFTGTWVGKWDNTWCAQFTVVAEDSTSVSVWYRWLEKSGQPLQSLKRSGLIDGAKLQIKDPNIEIFLSNTPGQAVAFGHFSPPRAAILVREATRRCQEGGEIQ